MSLHVGAFSLSRLHLSFACSCIHSSSAHPSILAPHSSRPSQPGQLLTESAEYITVRSDEEGNRHRDQQPRLNPQDDVVSSLARTLAPFHGYHSSPVASGVLYKADVNSPVAIEFAGMLATVGLFFCLWHYWRYDRFRYVRPWPPLDRWPGRMHAAPFLPK